jgi:uncharacterized membrane protein
MKQRAEIKALARASFKEQRGTGILIFLIFIAIAIVGSLFALIPILGPIINLALSFVLIPVLGVGFSWGYLKIYRKEKTEIGVLFSKFNNDFGRSLGGILWMMLFLFLWSLIAVIGGTIVMAIAIGANFMTVFANPDTLADLLLPMFSSFIISFVVMILLSIPAIIKYYAYSLTAYVIADCPNVKATDAIKISMKMTKGHKGKLFVLDLSFIGWSLLSCLTLFILAFVFVVPYYTTAWSGFYEELKAQALESGAITAEELA